MPVCVKTMQSPLSPAADVPPHSLWAAMCQEATYAPQQTEPLFDHLVGAQLEFAADGEAERLRGLEIDGELELGRLLDGKVLRPCALQYLVHTGCRAAIVLPRFGPAVPARIGTARVKSHLSRQREISERKLDRIRSIFVRHYREERLFGRRERASQNNKV
jgi:hypothetical protein